MTTPISSNVPKHTIMHYLQIVSIFLPLVSSQQCQPPVGMTCISAVTCPDPNGNQHCTGVQTQQKSVLDPALNTNLPTARFKPFILKTPTSNGVFGTKANPKNGHPQVDPSTLNYGAAVDVNDNKLKYDPQQLPDPCSTFPCKSTGHAGNCAPSISNSKLTGHHCVSTSLNSLITSQGLLTGATIKLPANINLSSGLNCPVGSCGVGWSGCRVDNSKPMGFACDCKPDWQGPKCDQKIDHCNGAPCENGGGCQSYSLQIITGGFKCTCKSGFTGPTCSSTQSACSADPCFNGGVCVDLNFGSYACDCKDGYSGNNCDITSNPCDSSPCGVGATGCDGSNPTKWVCTCKPTHKGEQCNQEIDFCENVNCGQGQCTALPSALDYSCSCPKGVAGKNCDQYVNECDSSPCQNGGQCVDEKAAYSCRCMPGFQGDRCELKIDYCQSAPCQNNGVCSTVANTNSYVCSCPAPHITGVNCEKADQECDARPCQNGAGCSASGGAYTCTCLTGFEGTNCERNTDECNSSPCQGTSNCQDFQGYYKCSCAAGLFGPQCEFDVDECQSHSWLFFFFKKTVKRMI